MFFFIFSKFFFTQKIPLSLQYGRKAEYYDRNCPLNEIKLQQAENICRTKKARVAKSNLQSLKEIPPEFLNDENFKIIIMVRDPRGMALSRMQLKPIPNNKPDKLTCLVMDNFKKEISDNPQWRAEIMFVRYEDLSIDPTNMAEKLHGFSGIDNYKEFEEWIYQQTHADEFIFDDDGGNGEEELNEENYLTIKQSERVAFKWIEDLSYYNTTKIQGYCKDVMKQFKGGCGFLGHT